MPDINDSEHHTPEVTCGACGGSGLHSHLFKEDDDHIRAIVRDEISNQLAGLGSLGLDVVNYAMTETSQLLSHLFGGIGQKDDKSDADGDK